ncbi:MAG: PAS domain S-box protein, partial [Deltaproteobacteria bacterium]|nr:PAS domain S-box protein [Deltaproteobacteria bacterium]
MARKPTYAELEQRINELESRGKRTHLAVYGADITDSKLTEDAFRESEEKYRLLVESAGEGIVLTQGGTVRYVNPRALEFVGYSQEEFIARPMSHFVHPDDRERLARLYLKKLAGEEVPRSSSWRIIDKNGAVKWVESRSTLLTWEGKPSLLSFLVDITQQREAEEALRANERFLHDVFNAIQDGISVLDTDLRIVQVNSWMEKMYRDKAPLIGKKCHKAYQERQTPCPWCPSLKTLETGEAHCSIVPYPSEEAPAGWIDLSAFPLLNPEGKTIGVIEYLKDISKQKIAEKALQQAHEIIRSSPAVAFLWRNEKEWPVEFVTDNVEELLGYSVEDFVSGEMMYSQTIHPDDLERVLQEVSFHSQNAAGDKFIHEPYRVLTKQGQERWIEDRTRIRRDKEGRITHYQGIVLDITDRIRAEEALREGEEKYRSILESIAEGYYEVDLAGNLTFFNDSVCELLGYPRDELMGTNNRKYTDARGAEEFYRGFNEVYRTGKPNRRFDGEIIRRDGTRRFVESSVTLMRDKEGNPSGFRGIVRDVTERKQAEEERKKLEAQLHQAQKMEAIGTLAGGIAHDFNNLLMGIQGRASLMLADIDSTNPHFEHLRGIEEYVRSATDLTKQLLGFARGGKYEVKATDLNELADRSASLFLRTRKEITIHRKFQPGLRTVEVDRRQMEQVLLNLFVNAWQAMPAGGEIYLQTRNVVLDDAYVMPHGVKPGEYVRLSVTDTGMGMDEQTKQRLFDPFFTTKGMGRGTGLGLASAYGIIRNHNGIITVYSEKGHGSTFNIYLPASGESISEERELPKNLVTGEGMILLVDDEEMVLEVGKPMLEKLGYDVL